MKTISVDIEEVARRNDMTSAEVQQIVAIARSAMEPVVKRIQVNENNVSRVYAVERRGVGPIKSPEGTFWHFDFLIDDHWGKYSVVVKAELDGDFTPLFKKKEQLVLRTDSGCETGQVFHDASCECRHQLRLAMKKIIEVGEGMIIHIPRQDGRGMGLPFKLATMWLQEVLHLNTVESASVLASGSLIDVRTYAGVIGILKFFNIPNNCKINLATNNPKKAEIFAANGYVTGDFEPMVVEPTEDTLRHLIAKQYHLGHLNLVQNEE